MVGPPFEELEEIFDTRSSDATMKLTPDINTLMESSTRYVSPCQKQLTSLTARTSIHSPMPVAFLSSGMIKYLPAQSDHAE